MPLHHLHLAATTKPHLHHRCCSLSTTTTTITTHPRQSSRPPSSCSPTDPSSPPIPPPRNPTPNLFYATTIIKHLKHYISPPHSPPSRTPLRSLSSTIIQSPYQTSSLTTTTTTTTHRNQTLSLSLHYRRPSSRTSTCSLISPPPPPLPFPMSVISGPRPSVVTDGVFCDTFTLPVVYSSVYSSITNTRNPVDEDNMQPFSLSHLVVLAALVCTGAAVKCYLGSTDVTIDCMGSCTKTTMMDDDDWVVRACWASRKDDNCLLTSQGVRMETCYCNDDYCNTSSPTSLPSLLLLVPLLFSFLMPRVY
ncbi:hypothetical protein O3P69_003014 [Scylla paramamosain]|uniref:Protein sleepless n=1 Tax=Scylla paramamosain TaxID=85552 RepID=A0AAW0UK16_SCYPA